MCWPLKGNQGQLHEDVVQFFEYAQAKGFKDIPHSFHETLDADHGQSEIRRYWTVDRLDWLEDKAQWKGFNLIGMVESERDTGGKVTRERRYYLSSLDNQATCFTQAVRGRWGIENSLHWSLDVTFKEDACRIHQGQAAENFAVLRHMALSLLQQEKTTKVGLKAKRFKAALDTQYLTKVLKGQ
jgi:predicted transposase YbfD/YdcC